MNNKVIILWGLIIILLVLSIYYIGVKRENEIEYISLKEKVKLATNKYIKDFDKDLPLEITTEILEEEGYIDELALNDKVCEADISVNKVLLWNKYEIHFTCINKELIN